MAKTKTPPAAPKRGPGRPKNETPTHPVTGFRIPADLLADVDQLAEELSTGALRASRTSIVIDALREYVARHRPAKGAQS